MWCVRQIKGDRNDRNNKTRRQKKQTKTGPEKKTEGGQFINRSFAEASLTFTSPPLLLHCFFPLPAPIKDHKMWNWPINEKLLHWWGYIWISGRNTVGYFSYYNSYSYSNCGHVNWFPSINQRVTFEACEYYDLSENWEQRPEWPHDIKWQHLNILWCNWHSSVACICIQTKGCMRLPNRWIFGKVPYSLWPLSFSETRQLGRGLRGSALIGPKLRRGKGGSHLQINWKAGVRAPSWHHRGAISPTYLHMCSESTGDVHSGKGGHYHPGS